MSAFKVIHVAVGVIINESQQVLIAQRHPNSHKGGLWEFPGGKKEESESIETALKREFAEEIGIEPTKFHPFTKIKYHYPEKTVLLDVWRITEFSGHAEGREGQAIAWRPLEELQMWDFPEANASIIKRLALPTKIAITPDLETIDDLSSLISQYGKLGIKLVQFRQTQLGQEKFNSWLRQAISIAEKVGIQLVANQSPEFFDHSLSKGLNVNSKTLMTLQQRPVSSDLLFGASCHNLNELRHAERMKADFVTLSPVCYASKYGSNSELGWEKFAELAGQVSLPIYALGGISLSHMSLALGHGAFGIAGITAFL